MRTVIKYEANRIQESLETFYVSTSKFLGQVDKNFVTVSLREDYSSNFLAGLDNAYKMEFHDM